jgi:hypothetical protein
MPGRSSPGSSSARARGERLEQWRRALRRPDLYAAFPGFRFPAREVEERRSDIVHAVFNAWDFTAARSSDYAIEDKRVFEATARRAGLPVVPGLSPEEARRAGGPCVVKDPGRDTGLGIDRGDGAEQAFAGTELPFFFDGVELARTAHRTIARSPVSVGWDVALTADGPVLVEANVFAGSCEIFQFSDSSGPGTRAILERIRARSASPPPAARRRRRRSSPGAPS